MYLLDSNVVIDFCNAKLPDNARILIQNNQPQISVITRIELFGSKKIPEKERLKLGQFVEISTIYDTININIINRTIHLRQEYRTDLPDAIIAATALTYNLILITRNISDFKNIKELRIIDPYNL